MRPNKLVFTSLILTLSITGCTTKEIQDKQDKDYEEIRDFSIKFDDIFCYDDPYYFIYIYSLNCLHCELIKNDVISYAFSNKIPMKFIEYYDEIPVLDDVSETIGLKDINNLGILGTPGLLLIENKTVALNISGMDIIKNVLKDYN